MTPIRMLCDYRACPGITQQETGFSPVLSLYDNPDSLTLDALKTISMNARANESYIVLDQEANGPLTANGSIPFLSTVLLNPDVTKQGLGNPERWIKQDVTTEKAFWSNWIKRILAADPHAHFGFFGSPGPFGPGYNPYAEDNDMTFFRTVYKADCELNASVFSPYVTHIFPAFYPARFGGFTNDVLGGLSEALRLARTYYPKAKIVPYITQRYFVPWETASYNQYVGDNYVRSLMEVLTHCPDIQEVVLFPLGGNGDGTVNDAQVSEVRQLIKAAVPYLRAY